VKQIIIITLFSLFAYSGIAHEVISGKVINAKSKEPLPGANVIIKDTSEGTTTDVFGNFYFETEQISIVLVVSYVGYETTTIALESGSTNLVINLTPKSFELSEITVSSEQSDDIESLNTISKIDIENRPVRSSQDILRMIPGLFIAQHAGGGKAEQIFLRGFDTDHGTDINISVDGMPVNMVSHAHGQGYADLHFVIPELVNSVDFGKGPYYTDHGNLNTAGYVDFTTRNSLENNLIKVETGMFNTFRTLAMVDLLNNETKEQGQSAYVASEFSFTDGPFDSPQNFNRINLFGKYTNYVNDNTMIQLQVSTLSSKWDASGQIPDRAVKNGQITRWGAIDDEEGGITGRTNISVNSFQRTGSNSYLKNQIYFSQYDFELYSNFTYFLNNPENGDQIRQKENRQIFGYRGNYLKEGLLWNNKLNSSIGWGLRHDKVNDLELTYTQNRKIDHDSLSRGSVHETNGWLYLDETYKIGKFMFNAGLRYDLFDFNYVDYLVNEYQTLSEEKGILSPKLNLFYHMNPTTSFYVKSGRGFHSNDTRVVVASNGNDILPAATGVDIGSILKPANSILVDLAFWYMHLDQEFVYVGDEAVVEPGDASNRRGLDLSVRWQAANWLFVDWDVNVADPYYPDLPEGSNHIPLAPTLTSIGGLSLNSDFGLNGSIRYRYIKDRPANEDNSVVAVGYTVTDINLNYIRSFYDIGVSIENLFDVEWNEAQFDAESRLYDEIESVSELHYTPGYPFFAKLHLAFRF